MQQPNYNMPVTAYPQQSNCNTPIFAYPNANYYQYQPPNMCVVSANNM